ncbi:MAG: hypothetical protein KF893_14370 [Caldilineaceae bacterium]|nr:hypothetical protein [Caldilineaceae bacterium]
MRGESSDDRPAPNMWVLVVRYIVCYLLWFLISGIALWLVFLIHQNIYDIFFLRINPWQLRAIDRWSYFFLGTIWIVVIFLIEGSLRKSVEENRLLIRTSQFLGVELALVALSLLIRMF